MKHFLNGGRLMRLKYLGAVLFVLSLFVFEARVFAENISPEEAKRLQTFLKRRLGAGIPKDTKIDVRGYEKSPLEGFKKGTFVVESSRGSGEVSFLVSQDGKYVVIGEPIDTTKFENTEITGVKKGTIPLGRQSIPVLMSKDGKYLIVGELLNSTVNPLEETMKKISLKDVPMKGNKDAKVTIVEYSDFQCPFCKRATDILPGILKEYDGKVKLVYKQFPLPNHPWAKDAAIASVCAYKQGNNDFWRFHDLVFEKQKEITVEKSKEQFKAFAKELGLDMGKFEACLSSPEAAARVQDEMKEGQSIGVNSTPTFVVNGMPVPGANPEGLKAAIEASLSGSL
jgi:protein-disulfide isomerase